MASPPSSPPNPKKQKMSSSTSDGEAEPSTALSVAGEPRRRYKRRKIAIFLAYCGAGYQGMQKNPGARTIEGDLEEALFLAGAVPEADRCAPRRYEWARSARTDKGVSAVAQVVSGRFYVDPPGFVARLNSQLPEQIRIFGYKRVTNSFNAKKFCDRRRYVYLLPVFALDSSAHPDREAVMASLGSGSELSKCIECSERGRKVPGIMGREPRDANEGERSDLGGSELHSVNEVGNGELELNKEERSDTRVGGEDDVASKLNLENNVLIPEGGHGVGNGKLESKELLVEEKSMVEVGKPMEDEMVGAGIVESTNGEGLVARRIFCYGGEEKERFNRILKRYVGTHNFHNFTTRTKAEDPSAKRYIISFTADNVISIDGIEFIKCEVVGQSFMLHQIRKMIGFAVAMMRNCTPESLMDVALRKDININVPTAPEVGLFLDECFFTSYNKKWIDSHEPVSMEAYAEEAEEFKMKHIYPHIAYMEHKEGAVALWLHSLNHRNYPDFHFVATDGACADAEQTGEGNLKG